ncbi:hypothetical protein PM082_007079 [Marasmius tenuissimus]|nr:hypothetical protein PM082_007079 [Marasmius tenuissimus]
MCNLASDLLPLGILERKHLDETLRVQEFDYYYWSLPAASSTGSEGGGDPSSKEKRQRDSSWPHDYNEASRLRTRTHLGWSRSVKHQIWKISTRTKVCPVFMYWQ